MSGESKNQQFSAELLQLYYGRLFPYRQMFEWLSYGHDPDSESSVVDKDFFSRREFSFTKSVHGEEVYIRYLSFANCAQMEKEIQTHQPRKIDIGAVYNANPRNKASMTGKFEPLERELVFDIDLTDYDDVRTCCSEARICGKCWQYMTVAVQVLDASLREDFGFQHILWVYSGRRGIHCWVCDDSARALTDRARGAVVEFLSAVAGNEKSRDRVGIRSPMHPTFVRSLPLLERTFIDHIIGESGQGLLSNPDLWGPALLAHIPDEALRGALDSSWRDDREMGPADRWEQLKLSVSGSADAMFKAKKFSEGQAMRECANKMIFLHTYPRLDVNVSKHRNHLLKSPFCVHPKTGRVCVPLDPSHAERFNPLAVPTIATLCDELDRFAEQAGADAAEAEGEGGHGAEAAVGARKKRRVEDAQKCSLHTYVEVFEAFLRPLCDDNRRRFRAATEKLAHVTGDW